MRDVDLVGTTRYYISVKAIIGPATARFINVRNDSELTYKSA